MPGVGADYFRERGIKVCAFQSFAIGKPCEARRERRKRVGWKVMNPFRRNLLFSREFGNLMAMLDLALV